MHHARRQLCRRRLLTKSVSFVMLLLIPICRGAAARPLVVVVQLLRSLPTLTSFNTPAFALMTNLTVTDVEQLILNGTSETKEPPVSQGEQEQASSCFYPIHIRLVHPFGSDPPPSRKPCGPQSRL